MARQPEARLQRKIQKALREETGGWWVKIWGGPFQKSGIPDLIGCVEGLFFALEVKTLKGKVSDIQRNTIKDIRSTGRGTSYVVYSPEQAVRIVRARLAKAGLVPKRRGKKSAAGKDVRPVHGTRNRKNVGSGRGDRAIDRAIFHWARGRKSK